VPLATAAVIGLGGFVLTVVGAGGQAILDESVQSVIAAAGPVDRSVQVSVRLDEADPAAQDAAVRAALRETFSGTQVTIAPGLRSELLTPTDVPGARGGQVRLVAELLPGVGDHAQLITGRWPRPGPAAAGTAVEAALHVDAARALGVAAGQVVTVRGTDPGAERSLAVTGLWRPEDREDPYWFGDRLELAGAERDTVRGPLVVAPGANGVPPGLGSRWTARWRVAIDPTSVTAGEVRALDRGLARLPTELEDVPTAGSATATASGGLPGVLAGPRETVPRLRAANVALVLTVGALVLLLAVLAAALSATERAVDGVYLRARGAARPQLLRLATAETLTLAALAALPAAALAAAILQAAEGDLTLTPWWLAATTAAGCTAVGLAVAVVAARSADDVPAPRRPDGSRTGDGASGDGAAAGRRARATEILALAAVVAIAVWQLRESAAVARFSQPGGRLLIDPAIAIAPAVLLGATAVLAVRVLGVAQGGLNRLGRRDGVLPALVGWHAARRGTRPVVPLVALAFAAACSVLALAARSTLADAATDRATAEVGTDVVVRADPARLGAADLGRAAETTLAVRQPAALGAESTTLLAVDTRRFDAVTASSGRRALPAATLRRLAPTSGPRGVVLPPGGTLVARVSATAGVFDFGPFGERVPRPEPPPTLPIEAVLAAPDGWTARVPLGSLPYDGVPRHLSAAVPHAGSREVRLVALFVTVPGDRYAFVTSTITVHELAVAEGAARRQLPAGNWELQGSVAGQNPYEAWQSASPPGTVVRADVEGTSGLQVGRLLVAATSPVRIPVLLDRRLADRLDALPGTALTVDLGGRQVPISVAGIAEHGLPGGRPAGVAPAGGTRLPDAPGMLADLPSLRAFLLRSTQADLAPAGELWAASAAPAQVAATARAQVPGAVTVTLGELRAERGADPLTGGMRRLLVLAALTALAVAAGALLLGGVVTRSRRRGEFAVLRAVGFGAGDLRRLLVAERAVVDGSAAIAGCLLGVGFAPLVVPALTGLPPATAPVVAIPWAVAAAIAGLLGAAVALGAVLAGRAAAKVPVTGVLREGQT
jgi:hypothetical protein